MKKLITIALLTLTVLASTAVSVSASQNLEETNKTAANVDPGTRPGG